ncbi:MAG: PH domain-containing protein [Anaeroplasmataceae bacterium]
MKNKFSFNLVLYKTFKKGYVYIILFLLLLLPDAFIDKKSILNMLQNILTASVFIVLCVVFLYNFLFWFFSSYNIAEEGITVKSGLFNRRHNYLSYNRINTLNRNQSFIQKFFRLEILKVESGSVSSSSNNSMMLYITTRKVNGVIKKLDFYTDSKFSNVNNEKKKKLDKKAFIYKFSKKEKFMFVLLNILAFIIFELLIFFLIPLADIFVYISFKVYISGLIAFFSITLLIAAVLFYLAFIKYYNYLIFKTDNNIIIKYGILNSVTYNLPFDNIKGCRVQNNIIYRLFRFRIVTLDVVGYKEESEKFKRLVKSGIMFPTISLIQYKTISNELIPNFSTLEAKFKSKSMTSFFSFKFIVLLLIYVVSSIISILILSFNFDPNGVTYLVTTSYLYILYVVISVMSVYLLRKNTSINIVKDKISLSYGGFIKNEVVLFKNDVIAVNKIDDFFKKRKNKASFKIHVRSNYFNNIIYIKNLDIKVYDELLTILK